jgi:hypothetical protein
LADCTELEFACGDGSCVPKSVVCDGKAQCMNAADEKQNCTCKENEFSCNDGSCKSMNWWCDGSPDCRGGEDEGDNCATSNMHSLNTSTHITKINTNKQRFRLCLLVRERHALCRTFQKIKMSPCAMVHHPKLISTVPWLKVPLTAFNRFFILITGTRKSANSRIYFLERADHSVLYIFNRQA